MLDGGAHNSGDTADYSALGAQTIDLGGNAGGVTRIENITGNTNQTLLGAANNQSWTISGADDGNVVDANTLARVVFTNFGNLTGAGGNDTFTFASGGSVSGLINGGAGTDTVDYDTNNISGVTVTLNSTITNIETLKGQSTTLVGSAGNTVWNLNASSGGTASDGTTTVTFTNTTTIRNGSALNTYTANGSYSGVVNLTLDNNTWNHTAGAKLTTGTVTGEGALTIPDLDAGTLGIDGADLVLPTLSGFSGHLIIGGSLDAPGIAPFYTADTITINTVKMTLASDITSGGEVTLLAGDIVLSADITSGGTISITAAGPAVEGGATGNIWCCPGHTPACVCYLIDDAVFVGDTIFMPDFGSARCDFPDGDARTLFRSVQRLLSLPPETRLFMCHDYGPGGRAFRCETTVEEQRQGNKHMHDGVGEEEFVAMRIARDGELDMPVLLLSAIQINIRGGQFPPAEDNGISYLKMPLNAV